MKICYDNLPDKIWGEMYGRKCTDNNAIVLELDKTELQRSKTDDSVAYVWGMPGPDYNIYYFKDYGITWAFTREELLPAKTWKEVYGENTK